MQNLDRALAFEDRKMEENQETKGDIQGRSLVDLIFSWSLRDVLSKDLYRCRVREIPDTFSSASHYLTSFVNPLIEETHTDLASSMTTLAGAPTCEILRVKISKDYKPPKDLFYVISLKRVRDVANEAGPYEPENGDLIALTDTRPKTVGDLDRPSSPYVIALVKGSMNESSNELPILSSRPLDCFEQGLQMRWAKPISKKGSLFAVSLINMTTNIRIWQALRMGISGNGNLKLIQTVLQPNSIAENTFNLCSTNSASVSEPMIRSFNLNSSQQTAVASCIALRDCDHQNILKLIWGPPGTGKTKTVATLLFLLFQLKCRTITCAPTNIAIITVTTRLLSIVRESMKCGSYGLGDVVLFGNGERMKIDKHIDLLDVFLDFRINILAGCFSPLSGWKYSVEAMISLLEDPEEMYRKFIREGQKDDDNEEVEEEEEEEESIIRDEKLEINQERAGEIHPQYLKDVKDNKIWKNVIDQTFKKKNKKQQESESSQDNNELKCDTGENKDKLGQTFEEFVKKRFDYIRERLKFCIVNLYTHLPTLLISIEAAKSMNKALGLIESIATLLRSGVSLKRSSENIHEFEDVEAFDKFSKMQGKRDYCLNTLRWLQQTLQIPNISSYDKIKLFCLCNASLVFCTASSSSKLNTAGMKPFELLVIDEAAQLKECESTIPLQLTGLRHAILIGDELQLPAMVKSKISAKAEFGRSLFERLAKLGHPKHLLNLQYRMHPSISLFPNQEFYKKMIEDAPNVKERKNERRFLAGDMYGSYSFINLAYGQEEKGNNNSTRNLAEVAAVSEIIASLYKECIASKQKVSVGVISPYNAQVFAIQEKLGKTYTASTQSDFSVSVRSVDGFQGGEEDVIIISTVRNNLNGEVGFLSNRQRANVALTRARHCLWIVGNGATLANSGSVWQKLVGNAKARGCFHDAQDDKNLASAIAISLAEDGHFHLLQDMESVPFRGARWKVFFNGDFWKSLASIKSKEIRKDIFHLLEKLSTGWRCPINDRNPIAMAGPCSELLQQYRVNGLLELVWTTDIAEENSNCTQVMKVWDILPRSETPQLARRIEILLGNYTVDNMNRRKFKCREGELEIPMTWPGNRNEDIGLEDHSEELLSRSFASLSFDDSSFIRYVDE